MKKYLRSILCLVLALCTVMCFAACGGKDEDEDEEEESITGTYQLYEMTQDGETLSMADLQEQLDEYAEYMEEEIDLDEYFSLKLNKDGTGELCVAGEEMDMEYDEDYIWPVGQEDEKVEYTFKNGKFTMEQDGTTIVFKK